MSRGLWHIVARCVLMANYTMSKNEQIYEHHMAQARSLGARLGRYKVAVLEFVFDLSFVLNFVLGKLVHMFSQQEEVYNYYNDKGNLFNQWFVKKGWAWTTLAAVFFYAVTVSGTKQNKAKLLAGAVIRYAVATIWWILFTQWCFGLPIMDKVFVWTGGQCGNIPLDVFAQRVSGALVPLFSESAGIYESRSISSYMCRRLKGSWEGGHDPLGHVFLLVHSSLYLFHEMHPFWPGWSTVLDSARGLALVRRNNAGKHYLELVKKSPHVPVVMLLALWWFMLLMTNMYFHSLAEKLVGLLFGYAAALAVYYVPRWVLAEPVSTDERVKSA